MSRPPSGDAGTPRHPGGRGPDGPHDEAYDAELATPPVVEGTAIAAIVAAVGNVVFGSFLGLFLPLVPAVIALVSVVLGHLALARIRRTGRSGRGLALTALAVGYLWLTLIAVMVCGTLVFTGYGFALLGF